MRELHGESFAGGDLEFAHALDRWQQILRDADPEIMSNLVRAAVEELDASCGFMGKQCMFSGEGVFPQFDEEHEAQPEFGYVEDYIGRSEGVSVLAVNGDPPQVYFMFRLASIQSSTLVSQERKDYFTFIKPSGTVTVIDDIDQIYKERLSEPERGLDRGTYLERSSDDFIRLLRSTKFRRLAHASQKRVVDDMLRRTEKVSGVLGEDVLLEGQYAMRPRMSEGKLEYDYVELGDEMYTGTCQGIVSMEQAGLAERPIRRDADMYDRDAGICLLVELTREPETEYDPHTTDVLLVPITNQHVTISFSSDVASHQAQLGDDADLS